MKNKLYGLKIRSSPNGFQYPRNYNYLAIKLIKVKYNSKIYIKVAKFISFSHNFNI